MQYPSDLPLASQRVIEAVRDEAEIALRDALIDGETDRLDEVFNFIVRVFRAFAHLSCEAEQQGAWGGVGGRQAVRQFLRAELVPHAYHLAHVETFHRGAFFEPWSLKEYQHRVEEQIMTSEVWTQYLSARVAHLDLPPNASPSPPGESLPLPDSSDSETLARRAEISRLAESIRPQPLVRQKRRCWVLAIQSSCRRTSRSTSN